MVVLQLQGHVPLPQGLVFRHEARHVVLEDGVDVGQGLLAAQRSDLRDRGRGRK